MPQMPTPAVAPTEGLLRTPLLGPIAGAMIQAVKNAKEAVGHGIRAKRSKSGAITFDLMDMEAADAPIQ